MYNKGAVNMAKERMDEIYRSYPIPFNFIDEGKILGGMVKTRNFIEGCVCAAIASIPVFIIPLISFKVRLVLFIILVVPALVFGCIGINGDPISKFILYYIKYKKSRRVVSFNNKVKLHERIDVDAALSEVELPRDKLFKILNNLGVRREKAEEQEIMDAEDFMFDDDLEEIKKKEEEAKKMLKASSKYVQSKIDQTEYANAAELFNINIGENNVTTSDSFQLDEEEYYGNIPILEEVLSSQAEDIDDFSTLVENATVDNEKPIDVVAILEEEQGEEVLQNEDEEIIMLAGDFIDDYKETKILEYEQTATNVVSDKDTASDSQNIQTAQIVQDIQNINKKPPIKKEIILPWVCQCKTRNLGKFCSECGNPKP